ncbi:hypothetical protein ABWC46_001247 [Salmonella enterica subsp. enterica]
MAKKSKRLAPRIQNGWQKKQTIIQRSSTLFQLNFAAFYAFLLSMLNKSPDDAQTLSSLRNPATIFRIAVSKYVAQSAHKNAIIRREW